MARSGASGATACPPGRLLVSAPTLNHTRKPRWIGTSVTILAYSLSQCVRLSITPISSSGQNVIQISILSGVAAIVAMLAFSSPVLRAVRRRRPGDADRAAGEPAAPADRPERGAAIPQPAARRAPAAARAARRRRRRPDSSRAAAAQRRRGAARSPAQSGLSATAASARLWPAAAWLRSAAADRGARADRAGGAAARGRAVAAAMPSIRTRIRMPRRAARARRRPAADRQ